MDGFFIRHSCLHAATDVTTEWRGHKASTLVRGNESEMKKKILNLS